MSGAAHSEFDQMVRRRQFRNPQTGNMVSFRSLPTHEQARMRTQWERARGGPIQPAAPGYGPSPAPGSRGEAARRTMERWLERPGNREKFHETMREVMRGDDMDDVERDEAEEVRGGVQDIVEVEPEGDMGGGRPGEPYEAEPVDSVAAFLSEADCQLAGGCGGGAEPEDVDVDEVEEDVSDLVGAFLSEAELGRETFAGRGLEGWTMLPRGPSAEREATGDAEAAHMVMIPARIQGHPGRDDAEQEPPPPAEVRREMAERMRDMGRGLMISGMKPPRQQMVEIARTIEGLLDQLGRLADQPGREALRRRILLQLRGRTTR